MTPSTAHAPIFSLPMTEAGLTLIGMAVAFCWAQFDNRSGYKRTGWFLSLERAFAVFAQRRGLAVLAIGLLELGLRLALLPWFPVPLPFIPDEFSFLLAANTFASGRLTNPTPAMWTHFETIQVSMQPTYMSSYFPAYGLTLALGKALFGHPWFGTLLVTALMCAAITWMLQGWLPPVWALLGGLLAVLRIGLFSYWINTYTGGGSVAALGGALVIGAYPRLIRGLRHRDAILLAVGVVILALSRPFEGVLLCLPVALALGYHLIFAAGRPAPGLLLRFAAVPLLLVVLGGSWLALYDIRAFGHARTLPYTLNRATYATAPYWLWQSPRPEPVYRHKAMRDFYNINELIEFKKAHSLAGFLPNLLVKAARTLEFFAGFALLPPLIMIGRVFRDRRVRFPLVCTFVLAVGMVIEAVLLPYYLAPFTAVFFLIGLQCMRHLRLWRPDGKPVGSAMLRVIVSVCAIMTVLTIWQEIRVPGVVMNFSADISCPGECPASLQQGLDRAQVSDTLEHLPGPQLVIVRYAAQHEPRNEWVYNAPDIDSAKVIWARDMDAADNAELLNYYRDRRVWVVEADTSPAKIAPYAAPRDTSAEAARTAGAP
jgi:hypothetical protein